MRRPRATASTACASRRSTPTRSASRRGLAALVFDYRYFGGSEGEPRQLVEQPRPARGLAGRDRLRAEPRGRRPRAHRAVGDVDLRRPRRSRWRPRTGDRRRRCQMPFASGFAQLRSMPVSQSLRLLWAGLTRPDRRAGSAAADDPGRGQPLHAGGGHDARRAQRPGAHHAGSEHVAQRGARALHADDRPLPPRPRGARLVLSAAGVHRRRRPPDPPSPRSSGREPPAASSAATASATSPCTTARASSRGRGSDAFLRSPPGPARMNDELVRGERPGLTRWEQAPALAAALLALVSAGFAVWYLVEGRRRGLRVPLRRQLGGQGRAAGRPVAARRLGRPALVAPSPSR